MSINDEYHMCLIIFLSFRSG